MNQSALLPMGLEASQAHTLLLIMTAGGGLILVGVMICAGLAIFGSPQMRRQLSGEALIVGGGLALPVVVLTTLLVVGLSVMAGGSSASFRDGLMRISITGEMWWWRVVYELPDGTRFESANELRLPVGEPVELKLMSADVIHSFWAPTLAGKLDMIPGRTNTMRVTATEAGVSRGQCAEYCGGAHAFMAFHVANSTPQDFAVWAEKEAGPRVAVRSGDENVVSAIQTGAAVFEAQGCGACHTIRGTNAFGVIGPDLTHVGGRMSLAAGTLPNDADAFVNWIANTQHIKPGNAMPEYDMLNAEELAALSAYLESLK